MAPRKKSWAEIKAQGAAQRRLTFSTLPPTSAYAKLTQQNGELAGSFSALERRIARELKAEEEFGEGEKSATPMRKGTAAAKKVTKSKAAKKSRKPAKRTFIKRAAEDDQKGNDESSTVETPASEESWRPCGGENNSSVVNSTDCLGIARISTWQAKAFVKALEERLEEYGGADDLIEDELEHGSEELTDVKARFGDKDVAMMVLKDLDGEKLAGRKLQVRPAEG